MRVVWTNSVDRPDSTKSTAFYDAAHPINDSPNNTGIEDLPPAATVLPPQNSCCSLPGAKARTCQVTNASRKVTVRRLTSNPSR